MQTGQIVSLSTMLLFLTIGVAAAIGWVMNIIKLLALIGGEITAELIVRGIGVFFAPLGAVAGWL